MELPKHFWPLIETLNFLGRKDQMANLTNLVHVHVFPVEMALDDGELLSAKLAQQLLLLQLLHLLVVLPQRLLHRRLGVVRLPALAFQLES